MKWALTTAALLLSVFLAAPATGAEEPLLLVVSDFDAALTKDTLRAKEALVQRQAAQQKRVQASAERGQQQLKHILGLLRDKRRAANETRALDAPLVQQEQPARITERRDPAPRRSPNQV